MSANNFFPELNIKFSKETDNFAEFTAEPLLRGNGVTIGNSLRRILMTSIPGAAITSVKFDGVNHEFTNIDGVVEDVTDIILNMKKVRFKFLEEDVEQITIDVDGPCQVTANDIKKNITHFEVLNPECELFTINKKGKMSFDLRIGRGSGYRPSIENKRKDDVIGTIAIDSIFNPVKKVVWDVQPIATSSEGHERLKIAIETDISTIPKDAINHAAFILRQHFAYFMFNDTSAIKALNDDEVNEVIEMRALLTKSIDEMELSVRSHNCLQAAGIKTIGSLVSKDEGEMLKFKNFGRKSLMELHEKLSELELSFGMDISQYMDSE